MIRLPTPGAEYSQDEMGEFVRSLEKVLMELYVSTQGLPDPEKSLNNFRIFEEDEETITYAWDPGRRVSAVFVYEKVIPSPIPTDPWSTIVSAAPTTLNGVNQYTITKPFQGFQELAQFEPRIAGTLSAGKPMRVVINPAHPSFSGSIKAAVTNDIADLTLTMEASKHDRPISWELYEEHPLGVPIATGTFDAATETVTKLSSGYAALGGRALPLRALENWWLKMINTAGVIAWQGPTGADRDPLPSGAVTSSNNKIKCEYDDDTDTIRVTVLGGRTKTYSGLSGGGVVTYTVGDILDNATSEAVLALDEDRDGYIVEFQGGGQWRTAFRGILHGPRAPHVDGALSALVTTGTADLTITVTGSASVFPATVRVREDLPTNSPIYTGTVSGPSTVTKLSAGASALGGRVLPLNELRRFYLDCTDATGVTRQIGETAADRDSIPGGDVTAANDKLRCVYDEDTDTVKVTTPAGGTKTKTYSGLSGGGVVTYTVHDTLDDATTEAVLGADEVRDGYLVDYTGGGKTQRMFHGALHGSNKDFTAPTLEVTVNPTTSTYEFSYTSTGSIFYKLNTSGSWTAAPGGGAPQLTIARGAQDQLIQIKSVGSNGIETDPRTFTVVATAVAGPSTVTAVVDRVWVSAVNYATDTVTVDWSFTGSISTGTFEVIRIRTASATPNLSGTIVSAAVSSGGAGVGSISDIVPDNIVVPPPQNVSYSYAVRVRDAVGVTLRISNFISIQVFV